MIPLIPNRLRDDDNLDADLVNDDLRALARDIDLELQRRYARSTCVFDLTGMTSADDVSLRKFYVRRFGADNALEIEGIELVIYTATAVTWTVACSDSSFPSLTLATTAAVGTESYATSDSCVSVTSSTSDLVFTLSASGASTITGGQLIVHFRCDRGNQGSSFSGFAPTFVDATVSTDVDTINDNVTAAAAAIARATAADSDVRVECFVARALVAGTTRAWRTQGGLRRKAAMCCYNVGQVAGAPNNVTYIVDAQNQIVQGGGAGVLVEATKALTGSAGTDPTASADDTAISMSAATVDCPLAYMLVFFT